MLKLFPNKEQRRKWKLLSWVGYIGFWLTVLAFLLAVAMFIYQYFIEVNYSKLSYERLQKLEANSIEEKDINDLIYRVEKDLNKKFSKETWDEYAEIILSIYKTADKSNTIKLNEKIFCDQTKKSRIVDIAIHSRVAGHVVFVAVKLLPIKEPIDFQVIKYYAQTLKDINASKGVIICNGGFTRDAVDSAKVNLIDLCTLKDATSRDWNEDIAIPVILKDIIPKIQVEFVIQLEKNDKFHKDFSRAVFSNDRGKTTFTLIEYFMNKWNNNEILHYSDTLITLQNNFKNLKMRVNKDDWREIQLKISYYTAVEYYIKYFTPLKYKAIENYITGEVIISDFDMEIKHLKNDKTWEKVNINNLNIKGWGIIITTQNPILNIQDVVKEESPLIINKI